MLDRSRAVSRRANVSRSPLSVVVNVHESNTGRVTLPLPVPHAGAVAERVGDGLAEPGEPAGLERRHEAGEVVRGRAHGERGEQAGDARVERAAGGVQLGHVGPQRELVVRRELVGVHLDHRALRPGDRGEPLLPAGEHDQRQPRLQDAAPVRDRRA